MTAPAAPLPPERPAPTEGWLTPRSWRLEDGPPGVAALPAEANSGEPPLLWLIDRRRPLAAELTRQLADSLTPEERQRLQAYRLADDRDRFLLGRGGLRRLLGRWLDLAPEAVPLESGPHGKPHCPGGPGFNISHSGALILLALHPRRPVGVDVERLRPDLDWQAIARRMLPASEWQALEALPEPERPEGFLAAWCRLEARLKARGDGLAGLERLRSQDDVTCGAARNSTEAAALPGDPDRRMGGTAAPWEQLWDVAVPAGYRAAVALAP
jgi:4'-phosphopantetheinyl transferase